MAKNKNHSQKRTPPAPAVAPCTEPTVQQTERLDAVVSQIEALSAEHGPPSTDGVAEHAGATLEESLKRVEYLLKSARGHFEKARELEAALRQKRKDVDAEIEAVKKAAEAEVAEKKREVDQAEFDLLARIESVDKREATLTERESACRVKEADAVEQGARLAERELNAEQGFLSEKTRILKPVEEEVKRLRGERDRLDAEIAEVREKAEEAMRAKAKARAEKWAEEDGARIEAEAEARRKFDEAMARERQEKLDALRALLASERAEAEAGWRTDLDRRTAALEKREADLDEREAALKERQKAHRAAEFDLQAAQDMLAEDRAGIDRKVERLVDERTENLRHQVTSLQKQLADAREQRDAYFNDLESRRELDRRFGGRTPEEILAALTAAERERDTLAQQLRERPDARSAERLSELEHERSAWLEQRSALLGDLAKANGELATRRLAAIELEALRKQKEALEVHKQLLDGAVDELRARVDELTRQEDHRNPMTALTSLDEKEDLQAEARTTTPLGRATPTLKEFADDLRHRIATGVEGRTLYYAERDVRAFLGGLAMSRLMLLQGISGTGKTSLPLAFASAVGGGIEIVEVQAGWRDRQDLIGYYNAFHRHYYATNFLQALYKAGTPAYRDRLFMIVLDEINLSRPEQFFADFLSALEQPIEARRLTLVNDPLIQAPRLMLDGRHLPIPPNVWFVGTANHDESTAEFADKTYDRAHVMEMPRKTEAAHFAVQERSPRNPLSYEKLEAAFNGAADAQAKATQKATAWLRAAPFVDDLQTRFRVGWGNRLENQLANYLPVVVEAGGSIGEAMDHLLVTKVLRKLKDRHDVRTAALEELSAKLQTAWDELDTVNLPERCIALIEQEIAAKKGEELV
ncbi:AAA family ATPase [Roseomonas genomospecies 6]|uniref:ATPase dynein-related AAA domain-containing protein n=1 Tax=Roseomonas genomospecies 6 TaxID=214106 RepID=A0A9W7KR10_9PROT|nr:AAA family ATPase [Roseomonas genomospecies 6]KAA0676987.1 hypothetical protein DS843_25260 [Roseomonas genomospecies 6]